MFTAALVWYARHSPWLMLPIGAALALAFAPFGAWPLAVVCPALLFLAWQGEAPRRAAKLGFVFTSGTFLAGTYWLYHSIYVIGHAPIWLTLIIMLGLVAAMGGFVALLGYVQARWLPRTGAMRWLLALPAGWLLIEWLRGWILSGFPWLSLGYAQIDAPLAALAPLVGVYGIGYAVALTAGALVALILGSNRVRCIAVAAALPWLASAVWAHHQWTQTIGPPVSFALVQAAIPQDEKWQTENRDATQILYRKLTTPHLGTQLIVWPESALPELDFEVADYLREIWSAARAKGSDLVTGLMHWDEKTDTYYNGVVALSGAAQWYYKHHLVPFAEYFPVPSFVRSWLRLMSLPYSDFAPGPADQPALDAAGIKLGLTVCYEDSFGAEQLAALRSATVLVNVTNDAWFGDSSAPHQHLEISRMRALEAGRPLLRATNDGITAQIAADGHVLKSIAQFVPGVLTGTVQPRTGLTPYARVGNTPVIALATIAALFGIYLRRREPRSLNDEK